MRPEVCRLRPGLADGDMALPREKHSSAPFRPSKAIGARAAPTHLGTEHCLLCIIYTF